MKTVSAIVYTSNTGFTRRYAELLAKKTGLPACDLETDAVPGRGTAVLYLGWLCAGSVKGLKKAGRRYEVKAVCAVGLNAEPNGKVLEDRQIPAFYLRGGYAPGRLTGLYAFLMKPMTAAVAKAPPEDDKAREIQEAFRQGGDWVDEKALEPVLDWLKADD